MNITLRKNKGCGHMKIMKLISKKAQNLNGEKIPTIAFLGDSVTQGCFEIYRKNETEFETFFDKKSAYHSYIAEIFTLLFPNVPINIINAGISGDTAEGGLKRLERDVLSHKPDLTVVCYGLNDSMSGMENIDVYINSLTNIFNRLKSSGSEVIFMTANMMNTKISCHLTDELFKEIAEKSMQIQNDGVLRAYFESGKKAAEKCGIKICDVYSKWEAMAQNGIDTTEMLANKINHPLRELNWIFAYELVSRMMSAEQYHDR